MSYMIKDLLQIAQLRFKEAGCSDPRLDAELLLCHVLDVDKSFLFTHYGDTVMERFGRGFFDLMDLRADGVPLQYLLGNQEFMGLNFEVSPAVLIPRQDTETLVELAMEEIRKRRKSFRKLEILDICTGSGAVAISIARLLGDQVKMRITASDISSPALKMAKRNAIKNKVEKIIFVEGDLFSPFVREKGETVKPKKTFDLIIGNPPYIDTDVLPTLQREVREHEPMLALDGGEKGLQLLKRILKEAPNHLNKNGAMMLEIGHDQGEAMIEMAESYNIYTEIRVEKDLAGRDRVFIAYAR
ncbi:MAG: peptide chain release factor N(5)-glutamine methyltransferase [Anaerovoracaceae bacterium]|jgi:release factor glutamine methyltransferase